MISQQQLDQIHDFVAQSAISEELITALKKQHPDLHFSWCFEDDIGATATPYRESEGFNLYLVNSESHCSCLSNDPDSSSGVVIAEVIDDE
ncbi:DUF6129 family protein [Amphritea pacifica]|uniref:DUF6129 domain-containing protein n=1 Tax=Amphritea pacifica TaxID=2811233 RepID=A0ABS2W7L7_9GAMM|nr:DUF6129 family protein [Amphritea pacifica]MBN0987576.1 hypothetical protein [Amphritea pacifica]MBN1007421.1 hypothetical protein [Amphritea pacifica]